MAKEGEEFALVEIERAKMRPSEGAHPLTVRSGYRKLRALEADIALKVCERVAQGELLRDICAEGGSWPTEGEFMTWALQYPEVSRALSAAKALSSFAFEEEAVAMARLLKDGVTFLPAKTTAYKTAMEQLRWSAERRNPAQFSAKQPVAVTVPIQINTSLNLEDGAPPKEQSVYTIQAQFEEVPEGEAEETDTERAANVEAAPLGGPRPKRTIKHGPPPQAKQGVRNASYYNLPRKERRAILLGEDLEKKREGEE